MNIEEKRQKIRSLIHKANNRFCTVHFIKKNGENRVMNVQFAATKNHVLGEAASEAAQKAVATRKENHPNLMNVYCVDTHAIRSINLDTVFKVTLFGETHIFE
jgi:hypothetical protein